MKRLKVTILLIVSVLVLACVASVIAYKIPYQYHEQLSLFDPVSGETMAADFSIQKKPYFFTESLTHVRWKNELGNFFNTLDDDAVIFKKMYNKFHNQLCTYGLSRDKSVQPEEKNVPNMVHIQQYKNEFQVSYVVKNEDGFWYTKNFYGPANDAEEAIEIQKRLQKQGAEPDPLG